MTASERELSARLKQHPILSLDVFDTTLVRSCGAPQALYLWLGRRLVQRGVISCTPEVFARARSRAERQVWHREGGLDARVGVEDFYGEVIRSLWLDVDLIPTLVKAELELEEQCLIATPLASRLIDAARESESQVIFNTDTYFSSEFVVRQLQRHKLWLPNALCHASFEYDGSKATGSGFEKLLSTTGASPSEVVHAGDNHHSDVRMPRRFDINAHFLAEGRLNRYEELLDQASWDTSGLGAAFAGASRLARLSVTVETEREEAIRDVAAGVAAPVLIGYVLWLLHRAHDLGLSRLYFIARDGQTLADIARILVERLGFAIEIRYLYASRRTTNLAAVLEGNDEELAWVYRERSIVSPEKLLARLDIAWEEMTGLLNGAVVERAAPGTTDEAFDAISNALRSGPGRTLLLERAAQRRQTIASHLQQEGVLDGGRYGLVDFGGIGTQMRALHDLMVHEGAPAPSVFLIGLDSLADAGLPQTVDAGSWIDKTECYLYDHRRKLGYRRRRGFGTCVQMFCAADHGTVTGYENGDGRMKPVLSPEVDEPLIAWGLPVVQETLRHVAKTVVIDEDLVDLRADLREISSELIGLFWSSPTREEAVAWGAFPFVGAEAEGEAAKPLATRYFWRQVVRDTLRRSFPNLGWQHWYEGSVRQSGAMLRSMLGAAYRTYRNLERSPTSRAYRALRLAKRLRGRR